MYILNANSSMHLHFKFPYSFVKKYTHLIFRHKSNKPKSLWWYYTFSPHQSFIKKPATKDNWNTFLLCKKSAWYLQAKWHGWKLLKLPKRFTSRVFFLSPLSDHRFFYCTLTSCSQFHFLDKFHPPTCSRSRNGTMEELQPQGLDMIICFTKGLRIHERMNGYGLCMFESNYDVGLGLHDVCEWKYPP